MHPDPITPSPSEEFFLAKLRDGSIGITAEGHVVRLIDRRTNLPLNPPRRVEYDNGDGYLVIAFRTRGRTTTIKAHRLVYLHCVGPIPTGMEINHKNGVKADNRPENLEVVTRAENIRHAFRNGLNRARSGERAARSRISDADAAEIRRTYAAGGVTQQELAERYGVAQPSISSLVIGKNRRDYDGPITRSTCVRHAPTDQQKVEVLALWNEGGLTKQQIADRCGMKRTTVTAFLKRSGLLDGR